MKLQGKLAVVTGAGQGIGLEICRRFSLEGACVYALDLAFDEEYANNPELAGVSLIVCDVRRRESVGEALGKISKVNVPIDILVNNAGVNPDPQTVEGTAPKMLEDILATNLKSVFHLTSAALPLFAAPGAIVNIASILGLRGVPSCAAYTASKGGIIALSRAMAKDYAPDIRVNTISPGAIDTAMFEDYLTRVASPNEERKRICSEIPLQRIGRATDVAAAALFLASEDAGWITGHNLVVDGGDSI